jgi:hypothetical protein
VCSKADMDRAMEGETICSRCRVMDIRDFQRDF